MMISHGGANSVMECLSYGKPIALLPICNDQFLQAKFVKMNKVGVVLDAKSINLKVYKDQLNSLLDENSEERINAQKIGLSFQKHNGPLEAAILIEKVFMTRRPLFPTI